MKKIYKKPIVDVSTAIMEISLLGLSSEEIQPGTGELPDDADVKERVELEVNDTNAWGEGIW